MKAPFGVNDIVIRVQTKWDNNDGMGNFDKTVIGKKYIVKEVPSSELVRIYGMDYHIPGYGFGAHKNECFRLYEPPKPEQSTKTVSKPVSVLVPSLE